MPEIKKFKVGDNVKLIKREGAVCYGDTDFKLGDTFIIIDITSNGRLILKMDFKRSGISPAYGGYNPECFALNSIDDWRKEMEVQK